MPRFTRLAATAAVTAALSASATTHADTVFVANDFNITPATYQSTLCGAGGVVGPTTPTKGGDPGAYLRLVSQTNSGLGSSVTAFYLVEDAIWTPAERGGFLSIDVSASVRSETRAPLGTVTFGVIVFQSGTRYVSVQSVPVENGGWTDASLVALSSSDFQRQDSCGEPIPGAGPDFSAAGDPIQFGIVQVHENVEPTSSVADGGIDSIVFEIIGAVPCPADVTCDGSVNFDDLLAVLTAWGTSSPSEDVDGDGLVAFGDVIALLAAWGPCV